MGMTIKFKKTLLYLILAFFLLIIVQLITSIDVERFKKLTNTFDEKLPTVESTVN